MKKKIFPLFLCCLMMAKPLAALVPQDYAKYFKINLEEELPTLAELSEKYADQTVLYDKKYDYGWNIEDVFNEIFRIQITA